MQQEAGSAAEEQRELQVIAAIQDKVTGIIATLTQARAGIAEVIAFLGACGYEMGQRDLDDLGSLIEEIMRTLTAIRLRYLFSSLWPSFATKSGEISCNSNPRKIRDS